MWVRKTQTELYLERKSRRIKYEYFIVLSLIFVFWWLYSYIGSLNNLLALLIHNPEKIFFILSLPLLVYLGYQDYVLHGNFLTRRPGKICLGCGIGLGYSDDSWGFKNYGKSKPKWHQIKACKSPEKCDIAYQFEVKWVDDKNT